MTIDKSKEYTTRDGRKVRIYATDGEVNYPVHGAIDRDGIWESATWTSLGKFDCNVDNEQQLDLVEVGVKPIKIKGKASICKDTNGNLYLSAFYKESERIMALGSRVALIDVTIEGFEGDGL